MSKTVKEIMKTRIDFKTIEEIEKHQFFGSHVYDHQVFQGIDRFVTNEEHSLKDRAEAVRIMSDREMGCGRNTELSDEEVVAKATLFTF